MDLPRAPGAYALFLTLAQVQEVIVGRLGTFVFIPGWYVYLGSALGPGGLRARLGRHLRGVGKPHWHIDTLRPFAKVSGYCWAILNPKSAEIPDLPRLECSWSHALADLPAARIPAPGFGSSDCPSGCPAHLIAFPVGYPVGDICRVLDEITQEPPFASIPAIS
jgi:Uri superfamily endonuclease